MHCVVDDFLVCCYDYFVWLVDVDDCVLAVCQNGGHCFDLVNGYECQCAKGYTGETCDTSKLFINRVLSTF